MIQFDSIMSDSLFCQNKIVICCSCWKIGREVLGRLNIYSFHEIQQLKMVFYIICVQRGENQSVQQVSLLEVGPWRIMEAVTISVKLTTIQKVNQSN